MHGEGGPSEPLLRLIKHALCPSAWINTELSLAVMSVESPTKDHYEESPTKDHPEEKSEHFLQKTF